MKRAAIVGTAESWKACPWNDPGLTICSLNDAHSLKPPRVDAWYDMHPLDHFIHPPGDRRMFAHEVLPGYYIRPAHHLEWLGKQHIPVYLNPDWQTQEPPDARDKVAWEILKTRPNVQAFPRAPVAEYFGRYFTSSPALMMAHLIMQGCTELHIYGIHLSTENEYIEQRPNFEFLIGRMLGLGKIEMTVNDGMRTYATPNGRVILPVGSPVLQSDFQYAFEPRPRAALEPIRWEMHKIHAKRERLVHAFKTQGGGRLTLEYPGEGPNGSSRLETLTRAAAQDQMWYLDAVMGDFQDQLNRVAHPWKAA